jgi:sugar phosphate isomerase/epimerase
MYVSIRDDTLLATGFSSISGGLDHYGIRGIELASDRNYTVRTLSGDERADLRSAPGLARLKAEAGRDGVQIAALLLSSRFDAPDAEEEVRWHVATIRAAAELGAPAVRIDAIMHGEKDRPQSEREDLFARMAERILSETEDTGVDLGIENHGSQGNDPAFLKATLARVGSPRLGLTMDTGNFYWAGHPIGRVYEILEELAPHSKHTHVKNIRYPEEIRDTRREIGYEYGKYVCPIAEGDIDHAKVVGYLKAAGYDRDLCIEDESLSKFSQDQQRANIRSAAEMLRSVI